MPTVRDTGSHSWPGAARWQHVAMRLVYVDDSGDEATTLYTLLQVDEAAWATALDFWLQARRRLRDSLHIPVGVKLHAVKYLNGRGNPSMDSSVNRRMRKGFAPGTVPDSICRELLDALQRSPLSWATFFRSGRPVNKPAVYSSALAWLDADLHTTGSRALVMVDGNGTEKHYHQAHRALPLHGRRVLEDPWHQPAHTNHWIMIADLVSHLAYQSVRGRKPALSGLYGQFLSGQDVLGGPQAV